MMNIGIVFNSKSGRGRAASVVTTLTDALHEDGHVLTVADVAGSKDAARIAADGADILLVAGGDGSVHHALLAAKESGSALFHIPMGTENLFARQFGMTREVHAIRAAILAHRTTTIDLGMVQRDRRATHFGLMLSIGLDASIMHRMASSRSGAISHLTYAKPILAEVLRPTLRPLQVLVDGRPLVRHESGLLIVANSRQYALRLDPATRASMTDGKLDVVFFPAENIIGAIRWYAASWLRDHLDDPGVRYAQATKIHVDAGDLPSQIDGEAWHLPTGDVEICAVAGCIKVLLPHFGE